MPVPNTPPNRGAPVARWLRGQMATRGLTLQDVAALVGVAPTTVSWWANGRSVPQREARERLAAGFGIDPVDIPKASSSDST